MRNRMLLMLALFVVVFILSQSCVYHDLNDLYDSTHTDEILFQEIQATDGFTYYKDGISVQPAVASPHGVFRLRFNQVAWSALDSNGELPEGSSFPNGAVIVKEAYTGDDLAIYAVMKRARGEINAGEGWLWAEYRPNGSVAFSISRKGNGCISCHDDSSNRDLVRTFDLH